MQSSKSISTLLMLLVTSTALGCAMCAAPYDYTGPVPADGLGFNDRAGSILGGMPMDGMMYDGMPDGQVPEEVVGEFSQANPEEMMPANMVQQGPPMPGPQQSYMPPSSRQMGNQPGRQYWR